MQICKITAPSAGNQDLLGNTIGTLENEYPTSPLPGFDGAHQSCGSATQYNCVKVPNHCSERASASECHWMPARLSRRRVTLRPLHDHLTMAGANWQDLPGRASVLRRSWRVAETEARPGPQERKTQLK